MSNSRVNASTTHAVAGRHHRFAVETTRRKPATHCLLRPSMPDNSNHHFEITSEFAPAGDQPKAIDSLVHGFDEGKKAQVLLGVTGSGKTFTMANVIAEVNKPTLVLSHNKTLAAQLY